MKTGASLSFWGTCSGTEPMPGRHHTALTIEYNGKVFWFDAGECCSYSAHLAGLDLLATEAIFISHTHMDHIGGLPNLLWTLRKLTTISSSARQQLAERRIDLFIPDMDVFNGIRKMLLGTEDAFTTVFTINAKPCTDGLLYDQHGMRVVALHNYHLGATEPFKSFSFRIEVGGKSIVYSGDVNDIKDMEPIIDGCTLLLMETGHHDVETVCNYLNKSGKTFGKLVLMHHGRAVLRDPIGEGIKAEALLGNKVSVAEDGMVLDIHED